jgi:hypothetical protein
MVNGKTEGTLRIWAFAFGYFACYVPYAGLTKWLSSVEARGNLAFSGLSLLPLSVLSSVLAMLLTFQLLQHFSPRTAQNKRRWVLRIPTRFTLASGLATAAIILTTTLAYTFEGVSIAFMMLLMRGGVLLLAPVVDVSLKRHVRWFSWVALGLSALSLLDAAFTRAGRFPLLCALDVAAYLAAYFLRLQILSRLGKSDDPEKTRNYFIEEQLVAGPAALLLLVLSAWLAPEAIRVPLRTGFQALLEPRMGWVVLVGVFSQGTGFFGGMVLLDARENSFCVPLNRAASILGGLVASYALALLSVGRAPSRAELLGAALVVIAVAVLWAGPRASDAYRRKRRVRKLW